MSALSTPGGGGTTAQSKPTSGKQKYQKLDINSLYCANRNESSEPSSVKSQLSRKHGMQSLGKVPSARRPPANLPSLKTETGQDPNANSVSTVTTTATTQATCISQTITTTSSSSAVAGAGWSAIPPPSSPHFRTEFPSLEAAAQPSHRSTDHTQPQPQLRPQTEGSWTCGGTAGVRQETTSSTGAAPASTPASQQTPAFRAILPPFLMKGSSGSGLGLGTLSSLRDNRNSGGGGNNSNNSNMAGSRQSQRPPATPRAVEVLTTRPILREDQISSLDDISRDAGWAQHDDIDYDQKLDFSDGETSTPTVKVSNKSNNNRTSIDNERLDSKMQDPGDEDQLWAERRQKQSNEVAQAVARARQRKEEEQRRQMRDSPASQQSSKDNREKIERNDRDRNDREREYDHREKDRAESKEKERSDNKDRDRNDVRDRDKDRLDNRDRERIDNRDRFDTRDRDRDRERDRLIDNKDRGRQDNRDRNDNNKERDLRDRDRNDNRDRNETRERNDNRDRNDNRNERERFERERDRGDRDRDRDRADRERTDRDRDFRERDFARERDRDQSNPFSKTFQANIPPRFLKQQQNRQQEDQHKGWAFAGKPAPRRQEPQSYNAPRHTPNNGRRSYSRDYSDREDEVRRDKDGPQWRSEMQDYDRSGRELDRSNSKDSYKEFNDYKDRRSDSERKPLDTIEHSSRTAADKLTEVFERKSIGVAEPFASTESSTQQPQAVEKRASPPTNIALRELMEKDLIETSWAEATQEEQNSLCALNPSDKNVPPKLSDKNTNESVTTQNVESTKTIQDTTDSNSISSNVSQAHGNNYNHISNPQTLNNASIISIQNQQTNMNIAGNMQTQIMSSVIQSQTPTITDSHFTSKSSSNQVLPKPVNTSDMLLSNSSQATKQFIPEQANITTNVVKQTTSLKAEKDLSESESIASKASTDPSGIVGNKITDSNSIENIQDSQKRSLDDKKGERYANEQGIKIPPKEPIERKSSGSGSEKKGRGYGVGGYNVYGRGWGSRESRGRRSHRSSRSNNRASESDGSTDGNNIDRKERRRAPRSPRGTKKQERPDDLSHAIDQGAQLTDGLENREPFAPRGQPSRRGRGGFHGTSRPPAPAKRVTGYGPPNTKSPFSQANRANKDNEDCKDNIQGDKDKNTNRPRTGSSAGKGRDRRSKGGLSGEDENWETTSEHSESGGIGGHRRSGGRQLTQSQKGQGGNRNHNSTNRQNNVRNQQGVKKEGENKSTDAIEAMGEIKITTVKKDEEAIDDGFQEVRNKKNSKEIRGPVNVKEEKQPRSRSNQGGGRNVSSTRNSNDKSNSRGSAPVPGKLSAPYDNRPRQANLAPRFVKQRQKQQMGLVPNFGPDTGAAPPPPPVNAWDKPIAQTLRGNVEDPPEAVEMKSNQSSQRSTPGDTPLDNNKGAPTACAIVTDKTGVLDGTTPPVETIIFENTNYKTAPPAEALKQKYQPCAATAKPQGEDVQAEIDARSLPFNGDVRSRPRSIQELMAETGRPVSEAEGSLGLQMAFDTSQKTEDSSDMKLDFDLDLGQLTDDKSAKALGLPRGTHMSTSNTISPLAADLNLKIASVKKVWEMHAVAEGSEELQFTSTFEENNTETGAPPNVCKVKPTQQLQSPPPQHYNHVAYQGGYGGLSVPSPPAVLYNSTQQLLGSSQQLQQQGGLYGAFLDQTRGQFGGFPGTPYGAGSATPYNYQPPPDMFQSLPSQYRMAAAAGGGAAFGQSGQLGNSPSTVLISSTSNSLMSATVKPSTQQIGAIGSKGGVGGVGGVNTFQQQYLGYSGPVGESPYSLPGLLPRPAPPSTSYYSPYQPPTAPAPNYPLQFTPPAQSSAFSSQFLSSQLHVAAAVQQMQQQYRAPMQQQYAPPQPRPPPQQQLKSPLHEHANGFAQLCDSASPTPKGATKPQKPPHSPPQHKYHAPPPQHQQHPPHPPPAHTPHQHHQQHQQHQQQMVGGGNNGRGGNGPGGGNGNAMNRGGMGAPRYPAPIQRPHAPTPPMYRAQPAQAPRAHHAPRPNLYYHHHQRNGGGGPERVTEGGEVASNVEEAGESVPSVEAPASAEVKAE